MAKPGPVRSNETGPLNQFKEWAYQKRVTAENWDLNQFKGKAVPPTKDPRFTVNEAAKALQISPHTIRKYLMLPEVKAYIRQVAKVKPETKRPGNHTLMYMYVGGAAHNDLNQADLSFSAGMPEEYMPKPEHTGLMWVTPSIRNSSPDMWPVNIPDALAEVMNLPHHSSSIRSFGNALQDAFHNLFTRTMLHYCYLINAAGMQNDEILTKVIETPTTTTNTYPPPTAKNLSIAITEYRDYLDKVSNLVAGFQQMIYHLVGASQLYDLDTFAEKELLDPALSKEEFEYLTSFPQRWAVLNKWFFDKKRYDWDEELPWRESESDNPIEPEPVTRPETAQQTNDPTPVGESPKSEPESNPNVVDGEDWSWLIAETDDVDMEKWKKYEVKPPSDN